MDERARKPSEFRPEEPRTSTHTGRHLRRPEQLSSTFRPASWSQKPWNSRLKWPTFSASAQSCSVGGPRCCVSRETVGGVNWRSREGRLAKCPPGRQVPRLVKYPRERIPARGGVHEAAFTSRSRAVHEPFTDASRRSSRALHGRFTRHGERIPAEPT
eukprot:7302595-Prymnesium_polylepis.2